jgi:hypothetical protein
LEKSKVVHERKEQNVMSTEPLREHSSTYIVQDRSNLEEMTRLEIQDKMLTTAMGGVLPELVDPGSLQRVLDVGCGTGGWLMETARTYPTIEKKAHARVYRPGTEMGQYFYEDTTLFFRVGLPFLQKWTCVPSNYHEICEQACSEMQQPGFVATMTLLTAWGIRPDG